MSMGVIGIIALGARLFIGETICFERGDRIECETIILADAAIIARLAGPGCDLRNASVDATDYGYAVVCDGVTVAEINDHE